MKTLTKKPLHFNPIKLLITLLGVSLLAACSSTGGNHYRAAEGNGYGYSESELSADRYRIVYHAPYRDRHEAMDLALLRAAEIALLEGKQWFNVMSQEVVRTETDDDRFTTRVGYQRGFYDDRYSGHGDYRVVEHCGLITCTRSVERYPTRRYGYSAEVGFGDDYDRNQQNTVEVILEIALHADQPETTADSFEAKPLADRMHDRYKL